jgi:hypothetical protein
LVAARADALSECVGALGTALASAPRLPGQPSGTFRPVSNTPVIAGGSGVRTVYMPPAPPYGQPVMYGPIPQQSPVSALFGKLTTGQVVEMGKIGDRFEKRWTST